MSKTVAQAGRPKTRYRTRNWREYNCGLVARGDLTVWISPELVWHACEGTGRRGRPPVFTDAAIQCVLTLKVLCQLPLRAAQGMAGADSTGRRNTLGGCCDGQTEAELGPGWTCSTVVAGAAGGRAS